MEFGIYVVTIIVFLLGIYLYKDWNKQNSIPGLKPTTKEGGNLLDISRAGSLHEFLMDLHKQFGSIASFWMGKKYVVSIHSPELFKQHINLFDRPPELFQLFRPFLGDDSVTYANGEDGRHRLNNYNKLLSHDAMKRYYKELQEVANELADGWSMLNNGDHIPLSQCMSRFTLKTVLQALFGNAFKDETKVQEFGYNYNICWSEMERSLFEPVEPGSQRQKVFDKAYSVVRGIIKDVIQSREKNIMKEDEKLLIDIILQTATSQSQQFDDSITYITAGFHTAANVIHALGVSLQDEKYWPIPKTFNPDRFSLENIRSRPTMAFQPYGFAGKRSCPGYRFVFLEATICLVTLLRKFKVKMVDGQVVKSVHGLVSRPAEEIWIMIDKR